MLFFLVVLTLLMLAAFYLDATRYLIPNWLNTMVILLYVVFVLSSPVAIGWLSGIYAFILVFIVGFPIFFFRLMGGGDVKLLIALALWCGLSETLAEFVIYTGLLGGVLSVALLSIRPFAAWLCAKSGKDITIPKILTYGQDIPYGLAITTAFLIVLWNGKVAGLPVKF